MKLINIVPAEPGWYVPHTFRNKQGDVLRVEQARVLCWALVETFEGGRMIVPVDHLNLGCVDQFGDTPTHAEFMPSMDVATIVNTWDEDKKARAPLLREVPIQRHDDQTHDDQTHDADR